MNINAIAIGSIFCLVGATLIVFNRQIGAFADRIDPFPSLRGLYFPRVNAIVIGMFLIVLGILGLVD